MRLRSMLFALMAGLQALTISARADDSTDAVLLERLMGPRAIGFARLDLAHVTADQLSIPLALAALAKNAGRESPENLVAAARELHQAGPRYAYMIFQAPPGVKYVPESFYLVPIESNQSAEKVERALRGLTKATFGDAVQVKRVSSAFVAGGDAALQGLAEATSVEAGRDVAAALAPAGESTLLFALAPSNDQRRVLQELLPLLPPEALRKEFAGSTAGFRWGFAAFLPTPELPFRMVVQYGDEAQARSAASAMAALGPAFGKPYKAEHGLAAVKPKAAGNQVVVELDADGFRKSTAFLEPFVTSVTSAAERAIVSNRMKQVGIAFFNYESAQNEADRKGRFPDAASRDSQGRPLLSWRVTLLPYLEQNELYREFHLDEPWDSEHNRKLITRMPEIYRLGTPANIEAGKTCLVLPIGEETVFPDGEGVKLKNITDGLSNTILAVEATDANAVIWTRPDDLAVNEEEPGSDLGGHFGPGFLALMADGSVQYFEHASEDKIRALLSREGGESNAR